jgi:antitoxin component YwqK of YwqJK toxin-antitoxin module
MKKATTEQYVQYHKDDSLWARGQTIDGVPTGYWEWFRRNGTKLRSGSFEKGEQTGEWTTYDQDGKVHNVTVIKKTPKPTGKKS